MKSSRLLCRSLLRAGTCRVTTFALPARFSTQASREDSFHVYSQEEVANMTLAEWAEAFKKQTIDVASMDVEAITYLESAARLRSIVQSGLLRHTDLSHRPERFFLAHRLLAEHAPRLGPGFWIRFTVHYNLCMGTVLGLGSDEQVRELDEIQARGDLGCFSLTEKFAGVNSGLVVNTTASFDAATGDFVLNTPDEGSKKNWISQGFVADKTVVVADLLMDGKSLGPHAFMMSLRQEQNGDLVPGVTVGDMGPKTVGNDLDNAWVHFDHVRVPKSALLNKYADIEHTQEGGDAEYVQKVKGMPVFHMIGQRLFTGRVAVAQAALAFRKGIFASAAAYTEQKVCWSPVPGEKLTLSALPQLQHLFGEALDPVRRIERFVQLCEEDLSDCLREDRAPSLQLVEAIAVAKVKAVEESIALTHQLRNEVGSFALMRDSGFAQTDFLQCCKFAEGDSRILMQKMARDRVRLFEKAVEAGKGGDDKSEEAVLCAELLALMEQDVKAGTCAHKQVAWNHRWKEVYALSDAVMRRVMADFLANRE